MNPLTAGDKVLGYICLRRSGSMPKRHVWVVLLVIGLGGPFAAPDRARAGFVTAKGLGTEIDTPVQKASINLTPTNWSPTTTSLIGANPFTINQFDASKYTTIDPKTGHTLYAVLDKITISLGYTFQNTIRMRFDNQASITVAANGTIHLYGIDSKTDMVTPGVFNPPASTVKSIPGNKFPQFVTLPTQTVSGSSTQAYVDASNLKLFSGVGVVHLPSVANAASLFTVNSGNGFGSSVTAASATVSVFYTYHLVIPEPASLALTGVGIVGGLGLFGRRLRRRGLSAA
jgi:hypothetical protein